MGQTRLLEEVYKTLVPPVCNNTSGLFIHRYSDLLTTGTVTRPVSFDRSSSSSSSGADVQAAWVCEENDDISTCD